MLVVILYEIFAKLHIFLEYEQDIAMFLSKKVISFIQGLIIISRSHKDVRSKKQNRAVDLVKSCGQLFQDVRPVRKAGFGTKYEKIAKFNSDLLGIYQKSLYLCT